MQFIKISILFLHIRNIFFRNILFYIEIRTDEKVTEPLGSLDTIEYAEALVQVQKKIQSKKSIIPDSLSTYLIGESKSILAYRVNYLLNKKIKQKTNKFLLCLLFLLPIATNSIIFEACFDDSPKLEGTISEQELLNEMYLIQHKDGTYSLSDGKETYIVNDPNNLIRSGMKIVKE